MWRILEKVTYAMDWVAGWIVLASMFLVTGNVILRPFDRPIEGTYEWTGFLTALAIGLSLAYCALKGGHTIITLLVDLFPRRLRQADRMLVRVLTAAFLMLAAWQVGVYANNTRASGEVAPTTDIPFWPIMYVVAFGLAMYALVELAKVVRFVGNWFEPRAADFYAPMPDSCPVPQDDGKDAQS